MFKFSSLVLLASLLILASCSKPHMLMFASRHYNPGDEKRLLENKSKYLKGKKNSQVVNAPTISENGYVTTYFFWEQAGQRDSAQDDDRIVVPESVDINNAAVTVESDTVEKVIINNVESIYPHDPDWLSKLIAMSEALPAGEHRVQFDGRELFRPGVLSHYNHLYTYLENISFFTDFKISYHYDPADDIYNTSIWLIKK